MPTSTAPTRPATANKVVRLSVNLSKEVADALRKIADRHQTSITEAIRRAISTQTYIEDAASRGATILIKEPGDAPMRELVFVR